YKTVISICWLEQPISPFSHPPTSRRLSATNYLFLLVTTRYEKPNWNLESTEIEVALEKPFCKLLHFKPAAAASRQKVLVVAPLSGHHSTLVRDTVRSLLADYDVWVTDWVDARMVPLSEGLFHL